MTYTKAKVMGELINDFLRESNAIEDVWDEDSLLQARYAWDFLIKQKQLTTGNILKTHKILMLHQKLQPDEKGYLRKVNVMVGGEIKAKWYVVPELVNHWLSKSQQFFTEKLNEKEKELLIKQMHIEFENIHPFVDGNGRIGRILLNWQRVKFGLFILVIKEKEKQEYYKWFN